MINSERVGELNMRINIGFWHVLYANGPNFSWYGQQQFHELFIYPLLATKEFAVGKIEELQEFSASQN